MRKFRSFFHLVFYTFVFLLYSYQPVLSSQETLGEGVDCTDVTVNYIKDPTLTKEERLRRMDEAFQDSLSKFEYCQSAQAQKEATGTGEAVGSNGYMSAGSAGSSVPSSTMTGTEPSAGSPSTDTFHANESDSSHKPQTLEETGSIKGKKRSSANGKAPEDIPPAANDDVLASQIRHAAENEQDPVKKKLLWNEYRKYKGLPPKS